MQSLELSPARCVMCPLALCFLFGSPPMHEAAAAFAQGNFAVLKCDFYSQALPWILEIVSSGLIRAFLPPFPVAMRRRCARPPCDALFVAWIGVHPSPSKAEFSYPTTSWSSSRRTRRRALGWSVLRSPVVEVGSLRRDRRRSAASDDRRAVRCGSRRSSNHRSRAVAADPPVARRGSRGRADATSCASPTSRISRSSRWRLWRGWTRRWTSWMRIS